MLGMVEEADVEACEGDSGYNYSSSSSLSKSSTLLVVYAEYMGRHGGLDRPHRSPTTEADVCSRASVTSAEWQRSIEVPLCSQLAAMVHAGASWGM